MTNKFSLGVLAAALCMSGACVVVDDDDNGTTTVADTGTSTTTSTTASTSTTTSTTSTSTTTDATSDGTTAADSSTGMADTATTGGAGGCGWGPTGDDVVPEGYVCGGEGEDPEGMVPIDCPEDTELTEGGDCGSITGIGCCDAAGDAWYCQQQGDTQMLVLLDCE